MPRPDGAFLDVEQSLSGRSWRERLTLAQHGQAERMERDFGLAPVIARVLAARGVAAEEGAAFLQPTLKGLMPDPSTLTDMDAAAERLAHAIRRRERVAIFGDYDVDGAASSALLARFLTHHGVPHEIYIPDRIFEGYGPNPAAIAELAGRGAGLLVCVDCGSTSFEALEAAVAHGLDALVIDHHQTNAELPPARALVNPNRQDDLSGLGHLCAAGVVFMVLVAVQRALRGNGVADRPVDLLSHLDLVALATVCDVVPLQGLNRAFVRRGLERMRNGGVGGLGALSRVARQDGPTQAWHLGFLLGPRINAGGRIGDAALGARLLTTADAAEAEAIAATLDRLNGERQAIERVMLEDAMAQADAEVGSGEGPPVLVVSGEEWHPGVVGLLASRLKERFDRPAFAIAMGADGVGTGSGRSVPGVDLGRAVREAVASGLLTKGGGHAMAAGLTVGREGMASLRAHLERSLSAAVATHRENRALKVDAALSARGATLELFEQLEAAGPYGSGHAQPVFAFPRHVLTDVATVGQGHVRFSAAARDGGRIAGIAFRQADTELGQAMLEGRGETFHLAGTLSADHWRGSKRLQLRLTDAARAA